MAAVGLISAPCACGSSRKSCSPLFLHKPRHLARGFTLIELIVVFLIIAILISMLLPVISGVREVARRTVCLSQMRQVGFAVIQYRETRGRYPTATDSPAPLLIASPGSTDPNDQAGYSWITKVLPYIEELSANSDIVSNSGNYQSAAFDAANVFQSSTNHIAELRIAILMCPSFEGSGIVVASPEGEYGDVSPGLTNCMAIVGTHIDETGIDEACPRGICENGVIVSAQENGSHGLRANQIRDGLSNTLMLCESREQAYSAWYDGQTAVVLATPDPLGLETLPNVVAANGSYTASMHSLNFGSSSVDTGTAYMQAAIVHPSSANDSNNDNTSSGNPNGGGQDGGGSGGTNGGNNGNGSGPTGTGNSGSGVGNTGPGNQGNTGSMGNAGGGGTPRPYRSERWWGPSSEHAGGYIIHIFADGHGVTLRDRIDATLYFHLVTRAGRESVTLD
jgi:prepilin-type N-terminal cleavage/methylation domain-containing protein